MGKQSNIPTLLSQTEFDDKLNSSIDNLIAKGVSDDDIKFFIEDFKSQYVTEKKKASSSENGISDSFTPPMVGTLELQGQTNFKIPPLNQKDQIPKENLKDVYSPQNKDNFTEEEYKKAQNEGFAPPDSEIIAKSKLNIGLDNLNLSPEEQRKRFEEMSKPFAESLKKSKEAIQRQKDIQEGKATLDEIYNLTPESRQQFKNSIKTIKEAKDLNIEYPFRYYSSLNNGETNPFINENFSPEKLKEIGIDVTDFDGFITKKGYKKDYLDRKSRGLFEGGDKSGSAGENQALSDEMERYRMLLQYVSEQNKRANLKIKYDAEEKLGYETTADKSANLGSQDQVPTINKFNGKALKEYIDNEFPIMTKVLKEKDAKNAEIYQKHLNGDAGFLYGSGQFFEKGWQGIEDRINNVSATVYDTVGLDNIADNIRYALDQTQLSRPNTREVVFASGQEVSKDGRNYIVDNKNHIYDKDLKIDVTDLVSDPQELIDKSKSGGSASIFSPQGAIMQTGNVVGDMLVQLMAQASLNRLGVGGIPSAIIAQSALGYSSGLEDAYRDAKSAGVNDEEAKDIANDIGQQMAIWYGATAILSPQTKATEALFGSEKKAIINGAINAYKESGKTGFKTYLKDFTANVLSKQTALKAGEKAVTFVEEGSKEAFQENVQQTGELYINDYFNQRAKTDQRNTSMTLNDFINTTILSFTAGGLAPMAEIGGNKYNGIDKLSALKLLADSNLNTNEILNPLIDKGVLKSSDASDLANDLEIYKKQRNKIPQDLDPEIALSTMRDLDKIDQLEAKKKNLDRSFHDGIDAELNTLRENIKNNLNPQKKEAKTESTVTPEAQSFAEQLGTPEDISQYVQGATKVKIGNTDVVLKTEGDNIKIESIATPDKNQRNQGSAREAINKVVDVADEQGKTLELNVVPLDEQTNAEQLASFYESVGFVKDENFDKADGGRMVREPQTSTDTFSGIDNALAQEKNVSVQQTENKTTPKTTQQTENQNVTSEKVNDKKNVSVQQSQEISTNQNDYTVSVKDGNLDIVPKLGNKKPSISEIKKVTQSYIENTNFDTGSNVDLSNRQNATSEQVSTIIASESTNPFEVAQEIRSVKDRNIESNQNREVSKQGAIAQALDGVQVSKNSFAQVDDRNNIPDINPYYFSPKNKTIKGNQGNIDSIREKAQQYTNEEVSMQDVADFIKEFRNPSEYTDSNPEKNTLTDLENKFQELTGLKPTEDVLNSILGEKDSSQQNKDLNTDVPFQLESNQTRISGKELSGLVDRLKKTGLAKAVNIFSGSQINSFLEKLGINTKRLEDVKYQKELSDKGVTLLKTPNWKSTVSEGFSKLSNENRTPQQWIKAINDSGGKGTSQELDWIGLEDFMNDYVKSNNVKSVPKSIIDRYIKDNQIEIVEVVKGIKLSESEGKELDALLKRAVNNYDSLNRKEKDRLEELKNKDSKNQTKYKDYQLEGGENYREILLTLPKNKGQQFAQQMREKYGFDLNPSELYQEMTTEERDIQAKLNQESGLSTFRSSHFDETNILAHIRLNERTLPNGERVLFIEEIQSDWAQEGKKKGFNSDLFRGNFRNFVEQEKGLRLNEEQLLAEFNNNQGELKQEFLKRTDRNKTPDMPYKKTDQWVGMAMRRVMQMATQEGFDRVAWTTGEQQAERYDLSKQVDYIDYWKNPNGTFGFATSVELTKPSELTANELERYVGKDIAEKIINDKSNPTEYNPKRLEGNDLKVGGEGIKAFYNNIVPNVARKEAQRFDKNSKVDVIELTTNSFNPNSLNELAKKYNEETFTISKAVRENDVKLQKEIGLSKEDINFVKDFLEGKSKQLSIKLSDKAIGNLGTSIPLFQKTTTNGTKINGFTYNGEVYLNRDEVKADTPIHEFGHLWNDYAKNNFNEHYQKGLDLIENSEYHKAVKENPAYKHLNKEGQLEEALAQAIGEKGVKILNESKKEKFATWFKNLFNRIAKGLGITSLSGEQLANVTLQKYTDLVAGELLAGREIVSQQQSKQPKTKVNEADVNNIDVIVSVQEAVQNLKNKLREEAKAKTEFINDVKKQLIGHINSVIDSKRINELQKSELSKLLNNVKNAKTKRNLLKAIDAVNDIATGLDNKILRKNINTLFKRNLSKKESGRRKANITTEEAEKIIRGIKKNIDVPIDPNDRKPKTERVQERKIDLVNQIDALNNKTYLTPEEESEFDVLNVSLDYLESLTTKDVNLENSLLNSVHDFIKEIYDNGRNELKALREERKQSDRDFVESINEDVNPEGITSLKTTQELDNENKQLKNILKRAVFTIFDGKLIGSLDSLASLLSRKGGENRDSSPLVQFVNRLKSNETFKKTRINNLTKKVVDAQKNIFGNVTRASKILNQKHTLTLERFPNNNPNEAKEPVNIDLTNSQLLNIWMNSQNEDLLSGLEANGFDEEVLQKIDDMLPDQVKEYGEFLFGIYEDMYVDSNAVYERMNFHSLGKPKNYAGKVFRGNVNFEEDTNALLGGITNINTTGYGSQKERVINNNPIQAVDVNYLVQKAIQESSHYVAFAESHRLYNKLLKDNSFQKSVQLTNKGNGDQILSLLNYYKVRDLEQGGSRSVGWLDFFGRNIAKSTLAIKPKIGLTQTISALNGALDMPSGLSPAKFLSYYNPATWYKTAQFLKENSDYIKNRYGVGGIDEAVLGLKDISSQSEFAFSSSSLEAQRKSVARAYKTLLDKAMLNVKIGDRIAVMGAVPAYNAWYDRFRSQGDSESVAREKALKKFEASVDRSQQTTSAFGKSQFQKHPVARYLTMFATAPIQNQQNAMYHYRELMRGLRKGQSNAKGSNLRNALGILNYQFVQPIMYTYIAQIMAVSISRALGFGDDEPDDADKDLLRSAIMGNTNSIPIFGGLSQLMVERSLGKDYSFGSLLSSPLYDNTQKLQEEWINAYSAKTEKTRQKNLDKALRSTAGLLLAFPNYIYDNTDLDYRVLDDIYYDDDVDAEVKFLKGFGYSDYVIEQARTKRISRAKSEKQKNLIKNKYERSLKKTDEYKTNPLFKVQNDKEKRK